MGSLFRTCIIVSLAVSFLMCIYGIQCVPRDNVKAVKPQGQTNTPSTWPTTKWRIFGAALAPSHTMCGLGKVYDVNRGCVPSFSFDG